MESPILYPILKLYIRLSLRFYFKRYQIAGSENIPKGPVLFVSNHQNAFLDALLITCSSSSNPYFLARASIFKKKWANRLLNAIRIIPIYRIRDGFSSVKKNDQVFEQCNRILSGGNSILIFPEGNHDNRYLLRPLQKGAARIALEAENRNSFNLNLKIVPVGIQYKEYDKVGNSVLVSFGPAISVAGFKDLYHKYSTQAVQEITQKMEEAMLPLIISIPSENYSNTLEKWRYSRIENSNLKVQLYQDQQLIEEIEANPNRYEINKRKQTNKPKSNWIHYPFYVLTKINLIIPSLWISNHITHKLMEPMFEGSMRFAFWAFPGMIILIIQSLVLYLLTSQIGIALLYFTISIFVGRIAIITNNTHL
jgi:1-acyl-sn-glycerol-3-phosphate acyltransferase